MHSKSHLLLFAFWFLSLSLLTTIRASIFSKTKVWIKASCKIKNIHMDLFNALLNLVVPPATMVMMAFSWPTLTLIRTMDWLLRSLNKEDMEDKVVVITGASSAIGEQIAYEYAKMKANLVLVARRDYRLRTIRENARSLGAKTVLVMAADVVKEEECRRFVADTITYFGHLDHLVNTVSLEHTFHFEEALDTSVFPHLMDINFWGNVYPTYVSLPHLRESRGRIVVNASIESWLPVPRMSLYAAAKAAVVNFYESLRFEIRDDVRITIATQGWIGSEMSRGRFMLEDGAEMQWKEEREVPATGGHVGELAKMIVAGACRGDQYVKQPSWYDTFLLYRAFAPDVLSWTFHLLFSGQVARKTAVTGTGRPLLEGPPPRRFLPAPPSVQYQ